MCRKAAFLLFICATVSFFAISKAQESNSTATDHKSSDNSRLVIVPLVTLKPGETKELLFSTPCTVGFTRGGGFSLAEMRNGKPNFEKSTLQGNRSFNKQGVTVSVASFEQGIKFANSAEFSALKKLNIDAFTVTVAASRDAQPGILEMHLVDATCSGNCKTDFRVLVVEP
jgi:hypothetical protein